MSYCTYLFIHCERNSLQRDIGSANFFSVSPIGYASGIGRHRRTLTSAAAGNQFHVDCLAAASFDTGQLPVQQSFRITRRLRDATARRGRFNHVGPRRHANGDVDSLSRGIALILQANAEGGLVVLDGPDGVAVGVGLGVAIGVGVGVGVGDAEPGVGVGVGVGVVVDIVKFASEISKKIFPSASILMRAVSVMTLGSVTISLPSFAVEAARVVGKVRPPSVDNEILTFAALTGAAFVLATSHVTVVAEPLR